MMRRKPDELMTKRSTRSRHLLGILDDDDDHHHQLIISTKKAIFRICGYCLYSNIFKCPQTTWTPWREQLMCCCYGFVLDPHANIQEYNENRLTARTKVHCAAALVQATGRCLGCYPQRPDAGTRDGRCQTPPLILVPFRPRHSDWRVSSSCGRSPESDAPDTPGSSGRDPAGASGSSPWKGVNTSETGHFKVSDEALQMQIHIDTVYLLEFTFLCLFICTSFVN